jgi:2-oxo-3-hexenedioate decarboxylase
MSGLEAGMRALLARREAELSAGARPVGWKVGFNLPALWPQLGIEAPVAGYLTSSTVVEPGSAVSLEGWTRPVLEPEIAITVGEDGGVAALAPAIEVIDADLPFEDVEAILARNIFHRAVAFGAPAPRPSLDGFACRVTRNGEEAGVADSTEDPGQTVARVAEFLAAHGAQLRPGDRIIAGTLTPPLPVAPGDEIGVDLGALGTIALRFA